MTDELKDSVYVGARIKRNSEKIMGTKIQQD